MGRRLLLFVLFAATGACQCISITGSTTASTTGSRTPAHCPVNSTTEPDGTCACYPNYTDCPGDAGELTCVQVLLDNNNCGECDLVCPTGESCLGGNCQCHLTTCISDGGVICTDTELDPLNCTACGLTCDFGEHCSLGRCFRCSFPTAYCGPDAGIECVDITTENNCGGCGIQCAPDQYCAAPPDGGGVCMCPDGGPGADIQSCDGSCVDLAHDTYNCGACKNICLYGPCAPGDAGTGACGCDAPFDPCGSACVDPRNDFNHCGGCTACEPPATQCVRGNCQ